MYSNYIQQSSMGIPTPVQRGYLEKQSNVKYIHNTAVITLFVPV
jgi:hypothetical protein